jgi:hypothetical protein
MNNKIIGNKYKLLSQLGSGTFGTIYQGTNIRTNEKVAIKVESISNEFKILRYESNVYKLLSTINGIPKIKWYGKDDINYYMVIDLLGDSLQTLIDIKKSLPLKTILQIGVNSLIILMKIHEKGFIHRDLKPENFLLSIDQPKKIYLIDFGISKPYIVNNKHIEFRYKNKFIGTMNFASINSHNFYEQSRRDDLESLAYILIYFYFGNLEWMTYEHIVDIHDENNYIKTKKFELMNNEKIPTKLMEFYKHTRLLEFDKQPDYKYFIELFTNEVKKMSRN